MCPTPPVQTIGPGYGNHSLSLHSISGTCREHKLHSHCLFCHLSIHCWSRSGWGAHLQQETEHICGLRTLHLETKKKKKYLIKIKKNNNKGTCQTNLDKARPEGQAESCITLETVSPLSISPLGTALSHAHRAPLCNLPCAESSFTNSEPPSSWTRHFSHGDTWLCTSLKSSPTFKHCGWLSKC